MQFNFSDRLKDLEGNAIREIFKLLSAPDMISFAGGFPSVETLPRKDIAEIANYVLNSGSAGEVLQYGGSEGYTPLRNTAMTYLERYGLKDIKLENVTIVSGGQQAIDLTCKAFLNKGDAVLVEDPTYLAVLHILKTYEAKPYGVKSDEDGINLNDLEAKIKKYNPKLVYIVPTFSNPTGKTLTAAKRKAIAEMTAKYGVMVLEDDPYSELRFAGERVPSIKSFDREGNVIFVNCFSKVIAPGLRTAMCIADKEVARKLVIGKQATDVHTSSLSQAIVNEYLNRGLMDVNLKKIVPYYANKKKLMLGAINKYMPEEFIHTDPDGGLFIWGSLDADIDTLKLFPESAALKVAYVPGKTFFADEATNNALRLNFSMAKTEDIEKGIRILGDLIKSKL